MSVQTAPDHQEIAPEDMARADLYRLLALVFEAAPDRGLLDRIAAIPAADGPLGGALGDLAAAARSVRPETLAREYSDLFVGAPLPPVVPYRAHYTDGQILGRSLAEFRTELNALGVVRSDASAEPEEHVAVLCEIMSGLIVGAFAAGPMPLADQKRFFDRHFAPWIGRFLDALDAEGGSDFYVAVSGVARAFMATESEAFRLV